MAMTAVVIADIRTKEAFTCDVGATETVLDMQKMLKDEFALDTYPDIYFQHSKKPFGKEGAYLLQSFQGGSDFKIFFDTKAGMLTHRYGYLNN